MLLLAMNLSLLVCAQNVGIGTNSPQTTLDVRGNQRVGGISSYLVFDSVTGRFEWRNANLYVPVTQALIKHSAAGDGLFYNNGGGVTGQLEYRGIDGQPAFFTNFMSGDGYFKNFLGIGQLPDYRRLHVATGLVRFEGTENTWEEAISVGGYGSVSVDAPGVWAGRFIIDNDGLVGMGTSFPQARLEVVRHPSANATALLLGTNYGSYFAWSANEHTYIRGGKNNSNVILQDIPGGRVGIGTTTPGATVHIMGKNGDGTLNIQGTNWISHFHYGPSEDIYLRSGNNNGKLVFNDIPGGRVGIGTSQPLTLLHADGGSVLFSESGNIPPFSLVAPPQQGSGRRMMWYTDRAAFRVGHASIDQWNDGRIGSYSFASGNSTIANGSGSISMGLFNAATGTASVALGEGNSASGFHSTSFGSYNNAVGNYSTATGRFTRAGGPASTAMGDGTVAKGYATTVVGLYNDSVFVLDQIGINEVTPMFIVGNGDAPNSRRNALTVLKSGNIGVGISNPGFPLNFANTTGDKISLFGNTGAHYGFGIQAGVLQIHSGTSVDDIVFGYGSSTSMTERMRIKGTGFVGIGTATPFTQLCVNGNIAYAGYLGACSDIRYKKDFSQIINPLQSVLSLNGFYYYWKKDEFTDYTFTDDRQLGFSAQEIEKLFPELVMTDDKGYKSVDYGRLTPVLVEAIKEQQVKIDSLQSQIDELKKLLLAALK